MICPNGERVREAVSLALSFSRAVADPFRLSGLKPRQVCVKMIACFATFLYTKGVHEHSHRTVSNAHRTAPQRASHRTAPQYIGWSFEGKQVRQNLKNVKRRLPKLGKFGVDQRAKGWRMRVGCEIFRMMKFDEFSNRRGSKRR